ncbi:MULTISPECIES: YcxB family protein [Clostridium]|uniref:YcxB family protein n=1 Tax=Clostridium beijerinckii TaxID=1520 RepID=A0AAW3W805_CLOBE|nr:MULTISPECIES: YcxB family protein [Clostridium]MBC2457761.1 YcxB family protein [Clostridium beijerinckii]MBC2475047.1 YcxB family protein [Clostridium beijerinckii]NOV63515.1 hypothetical protein [Clostridium beijerinckii]NOV73312.1 hypothetical protein [Clostridium beijerinckii]NOW35375.1 hypothetical protein [Clostridium beijerinckii]
MEVDFKISKDDLLDFHIKHIHETKVYKQQIRFYTAYILIIAIGVILVFRSTLYVIAGLITCGIFLIFRKRIFKFRLKKKVFRIYDSDKYRNLFEAKHLSFMDDGIKIQTKFAETIYNWSSINGLYLVEQYIFITTVDRENILIPIFSFNPLEDKELFLETIIKNTKLELKKQYPNDF